MKLPRLLRSIGKYGNGNLAPLPAGGAERSTDSNRLARAVCHWPHRAPTPDPHKPIPAPAGPALVGPSAVANRRRYQLELGWYAATVRSLAPERSAEARRS
jgi:hypothetical protein